MGAMVIRLFIAASLLAWPGAGLAQTPDTSVSVVVTLDHPDWLYQVGDTARYTVSVRRAGARHRGFPAMLVVPGAGVRPYFPSIATARAA